MTRRFVRPRPEARAPDLVERAVARAKEGDSHALHFLYVRFADEVCACVGDILGTADEADDIAQMVFAKLTTEVQRYEPGGVPFTVWILRFARKVAAEDVTARSEVPVDQDGRGDGADEDGGVLPEALRQLPGEQRQVLVLRHIAGLSPKETAERLDKTRYAALSAGGAGRCRRPF